MIILLYLKIKKVDPSFTKEFSLIGENNKVEKVRVKENVSLFNKNLKVNKITYLWEEEKNHKLNTKINLKIFCWPIQIQVSKCGKSGCKKESLGAEEEKRVYFYHKSFPNWIFYAYGI